MYYSERSGIRKSIVKTHEITADHYSYIWKICIRYYDSIAWKYPLRCPDGFPCCGLDLNSLSDDLVFDIPELPRDEYGLICQPQIKSNVFEGKTYQEYNQYALLDFIEYLAENIRDYTTSHHSFFQHEHITYTGGKKLQLQFKEEINAAFNRLGLLYHLNDALTIERLVEGDIVTSSLIEEIQCVQEDGLRQLLLEAIEINHRPGKTSARDSVEKIWDAFERLKTINPQLKKNESADLLINSISPNSPLFKQEIEKEFRTLTSIGNEFRIRHHETNKEEIRDSNHYDYLFNRCISLIYLAIKSI